jgi:ParB-like chromosome segregation protein Spo0J
MNVRIADLVTTERHRKDMGDIAALAASIKVNGLLHPIVMTKGKKIIAGARRIEAATSLGWKTIPATVVSNIKDAAALLAAERDENTCRKDFAPSEAVALGKALEEIERVAAHARQTAGLKKGAETPMIPDGENFAPTEVGKTIDKAAAAVGMSTPTYKKAKDVVASGDKTAITQMDATGNVSAAHRAVQEKKPDPPATDEAGKPIPDINDLPVRFSRGRDEIGALQREISTLKGKVLKAAEAGKGSRAGKGHWRRFDPSAFQAAMNDAYQQLKAARPYAVCPYCVGGDRGAADNCMACKGSGWLTELEYHNVPRELK